ncbi:MAG: gliding motility-associated peptidyl-prolyl isomerase GldI [Flavobacteriaceae bacterium]
MKKIVLLTGILLFACAEQEARKPIYKSNREGLEQSIDRNKKINNQQQMLFEKVMEKDSLLKFSPSPVGYWYAYKEKTESSIRPEQGDRVKFSYIIQTLEGAIIYDEMELGTVDYLVDKEELLPALRYAVKDLSLGDIGVFLMPSFLGYSYQGDGEKIGINQPLRFTIQLKELNKEASLKDSKY